MQQEIVADLRLHLHSKVRGHEVMMVFIDLMAYTTLFRYIVFSFMIPTQTYFKHNNLFNPSRLNSHLCA
jgi:hypothetical protein